MNCMASEYERGKQGVERDQHARLVQREAQIDRDMGVWSARTKELIKSGDSDALKVYGSYVNSVMQGDFDHIDLFVDAAKVSIDVGTNHGQYAMKLAAISKGCLCVEPVKPLSFVGEILPDNCIFKNVAAGKSRDTSVLRIPLRNGVPEYALSTMAIDNRLPGYQCAEQITDVRTVDELIRETFPDEKVGYIKIDVEGLEDEVIEGCVATLAKHRPNLQIELHGNEGIVGMCEYLRGYDYRGIFFFKDRLLDASQFDADVHRAIENEWSIRASKGLEYDLSMFVADFFFVPVRQRA